MRTEAQAGLDPVEHATRMDEGATLLRIVHRKQPIERNVDKVRIGQPLVAVGEGDLHGFDDMMIVIRRTFAPGCDVEAFEQVEDLKGRKTLRVRRQLDDLVTPIGRGDRVHPLGLVCGEVLRLERRSVGCEGLADALGDIPLVEGACAPGGQFLQRTGEIGLDEA